MDLGAGIGGVAGGYLADERGYRRSHRRQHSEHGSRKASFKEMLANFDQGIHPFRRNTPASYNDPDMMVIGMPGLTEEENRVHMSLWAISGAPLLAGADLARLSTAALATLTNPRVLAVDQDALGLQAVKVAESAPGLEVWSKPLAASGERAVLLLNRTASTAPIQVKWSQLGIDGTKPARVVDLWANQDLGVLQDAYTATVGAKDVVMLRVEGKARGAPAIAPQLAVRMPKATARGKSIGLHSPASPRGRAWL